MERRIANKILTFVLYTVLCGVVFYTIFLPNIIEKRARKLGMMRYNSTIDKMVEKDSIHMSGWELHYLKEGTMEGYEGY